MPGVWKKTLNYLGLVEDDEEFVDELPEAEPAPVRRMRPQAVREVPADAEGVVRTISTARPATMGKQPPCAAHSAAGGPMPSSSVFPVAASLSPTA